MNTNMATRSRHALAILGWFCAALAYVISGGTARPSVPSNDLVTLSQGWWGTSIDDFPKKAGLQSGEYSIADHPSRPGVRVILVSSRAAARWEPKELPAFELDFTTSAGLHEIDGYYRGTQDEVLASLITRYGKPSRGIVELGMRAYGWEFGKTHLDLTPSFYRLVPKNSTVP